MDEKIKMGKVFFVLTFLIIVFVFAGKIQPDQTMQRAEIKIVHELFRLRNEHKADSAEQLYADTVLMYMKYLKNVPKKIITLSDKSFWKAHPKNKFELTAPVELITNNGITTAIVFGKEYLDGTTFQNERIEINFDQNKKINSFRGFRWKK